MTNQQQEKSFNQDIRDRFNMLRQDLTTQGLSLQDLLFAEESVAKAHNASLERIEKKIEENIESLIMNYNHRLMGPAEELDGYVTANSYFQAWSKRAKDDLKEILKQERGE